MGFEGPGVGARLHGYPSRGRANCGRLACFKRISMNYLQERSQYLIAASVYDEYPGGPSIRPIFTRCCFTMTSMIQVCSNFHDARVFILNTRRMNSNWHLWLRNTLSLVFPQSCDTTRKQCLPLKTRSSVAAIPQPSISALKT